MEKRYPEVLKTKEDYEYVRNNFPREYWEKDFEEILTDGFSYEVVGTLPKMEDPEYWEKQSVETIMKAIKLEWCDRGSPVLSHQAEWVQKEISFDDSIVYWNNKIWYIKFVPDKNAKIKTLGYTVEELLDILYPVEAESPVNEEVDLSDMNIDDLDDDDVMEVASKVYKFDKEEVIKLAKELEEQDNGE